MHFAWYSSNIICMDEDVERLNQTTRTVMKTLQHIGFSCRIETVNAVEAWRGSLPGDGYRNVRRNLLHTLNVADLLPITAVWAGQRENPSALMPQEESASLVRRHQRFHAISIQFACRRSRPHDDLRAFRCR